MAPPKRPRHLEADGPTRAAAPPGEFNAATTFPVWLKEDSHRGCAHLAAPPGTPRLQAAIDRAVERKNGLKPNYDADFCAQLHPLDQNDLGCYAPLGKLCSY